MRLCSVVLLLTLFLADLSSEHPIYITLFNIQIADDQSWSAQVHFFYDDLEDAIQNFSRKRPNLSSDDIAQHMPVIDQYLQTRLHLGASAFTLHAIAKKNDLILLDLKGVANWPVEGIEITNTVLLELFEAQKNIVKVTHKNDQKLYYFNKVDTLHQVEWP